MPAGWAIAAGAGAGLVGSMLSGKPPDNSAAINQQVDNLNGVGNNLKDLATNTQNKQSGLVDQFMPLFTQQIQQSLNTQGKQQARGDSQWDLYMSKFAPASSKLADTALNYDTPERRDKAASDARSQVLGDVDAQAKQLDSNLSAAGVDPGSGAAIGAKSLMGVRAGAAAAAAGNTARQQVEDRGINLLGQVSSLGQPVATNSAALEGQALTAGNNATVQAGQATNLAGVPAATAGNLYSAAGNQFGNAGNLALGKQTADTKAWQAKDDSTKDWIMGGAKIGASMA